MPTLRILKPISTDEADAAYRSPAPIVALHFDPDGEYGVTIDGNHYSDLVAYDDADEYPGTAASLIKLAANLAVCANHGTLMGANLTQAATACGFALIHI